MKSEFSLSQGAGHKLENAIIRAEGGTTEVEWLSAGDNFKRIILLASGEFELTPVAKVVASTIAFNYGMSLSEMISVGNYGWKNDLYTEKNFPIKGDGEVVMPHLHHFGRDISSENAIKELDKLGLRPATLPELLLFGANNPEEQKKYPIVALDPERVFRYCGRRFVPALDCDGYERDLRLYSWGDDWGGAWRFAVVRK